MECQKYSSPEKGLTRRPGIRRKGEEASPRSLPVASWPTAQLFDWDISQPISPTTMRVMAKYHQMQSWPTGAGFGLAGLEARYTTRAVHGSAHSITLHAAEVAPSCLHLPLSSAPLTTRGYVSLTILYLLTREPLAEFSEGFVIRHFLALKVRFQLTLKA